jgi:uncharacterized protein Usg
VEEHYIHGNLISHNEYGDKSTYVSKSDSASNAAAPHLPIMRLHQQICRQNYDLLNTDYLKGFVSANELNAIFPSVRLAHENLHNAQGSWREFTGWLDLPSRIPDALIKEIVLL